MCPRCKGRLVSRQFSLSPKDIEVTCLSCGYEVVDIPQDVLSEVAHSFGKVKLAGYIGHPRFNNGLDKL